MGRMSADDFLNNATEEQALYWHLTSNHYPPIHESFIPIARQVIDRATEAVEMEDESIWQEQIEMPNGKTMTVADIYEGLHLDAFVEHRLAVADNDFEDEEDE